VSFSGSVFPDFTVLRTEPLAITQQSRSFLPPHVWLIRDYYFVITTRRLLMLLDVLANADCRY
jgi:hypothetical protein